MLEIKVIVQLPGIPEAINNLAKSLCDTTHEKAETPVEVVPEKKAEAPVSFEPCFIGDVPPDEPENPTEEQPQQASAPMDAPGATLDVPAPVPAKEYTFNQISRAGANLCTDLAKMEQLVNLLNTKYGVQAITMIDKSRYAELADDLIALGATIEEE